MNNNQNSLFGSSVRSYKNLPISYSNRPNLVKYLHTHQKLPSQDANKQVQTPLIIRNKSYDTFNSKIFDRPSKDKNSSPHQQIYQSINNSTPHKYINEVSNLQSQITRLMANQLSIKTEKEMLQKEIKKLKEEISYLNQKCVNLQKKNQSLFQSQSRIAILQRQYHKLQIQFQQYKNNCLIIHNQSKSIPPQVLPSAEQDQIQTEYYRLKDRDKINNKFNAKVSPKVSWKKTSAVATSPIYKLENNRKYSGNNRLEDLSLIESKIDRLKEDYIYERDSQYEQHPNDHAKTIDLKDLQKNKEYDSNVRVLQSEIKELRLKNIGLYQKAELYQQQKIKYMQRANEDNYQRTKLISQYKVKENELRKEMQKMKIEMQERKIKMIELSELISERDQTIKLINIEKGQIEQRANKLKENAIVQYEQKESNNKKIMMQLKQNLLKAQEQLASLKERCNLMAKKQQELQIENKLYLHQIQQKREIISSYQKVKQQQQIPQKPILLQEESILSKTQNKNKRQVQKDNDKYIQTDLQNLETIHQPNQEQFRHLKQIHQKLASEHTLFSVQLNRLRNQNVFVNDNYTKLSQLYQQQKIKNGQLIRLSEEWRIVEGKIRKMKHIDSTVDHLWQIKQVQYQNIHQILSKVNRPK